MEVVLFEFLTTFRIVLCVRFDGVGLIDTHTRCSAPTPLQGLEKMFSSDVDDILKKYGIVVDNVNITRVDLEESFVTRANQNQRRRMEEHRKVLVTEQTLLKEKYQQMKGLQDEQAKTRNQEEKSKQRDIVRGREAADIGGLPWHYGVVLGQQY